MIITENLSKEFEGHIIIVEGKNDAAALQTLGASNVLAISGKSMYKIVESLPEGKPVIILTDFDQEGNRLASRLLQMLQKTGHQVNVFLRKKFKGTMKVTHIEDLRKIMEDDSNGKIATINDKIRYRSANRRRRYSRKT